MPVGRLRDGSENAPRAVPLTRRRLAAANPAGRPEIQSVAHSPPMSKVEEIVTEMANAKLAQVEKSNLPAPQHRHISFSDSRRICLRTRRTLHIERSFPMGKSQIGSHAGDACTSDPMP